MANLASSDMAARDMTAEVWVRRIDLAAACRLAAHFGWPDFLATYTKSR